MKKKMLPNNPKSGFEVPKNYFGDFDMRLMNRLKEPSVLDGAYLGNPGFNLPEDYFKKVENNILNRLKDNTKITKVIPIYRKKKFYYAAAVAALFAGILSTNFFNSPVQNYSIDSIELSTLENYLDEEYINIDKNEISIFLIDDSYSFYHLNTSRLSDEAVFEYINENVEDPNLLFE